MGVETSIVAPLRRVEVLAYIIQRIQRTGIAPSYEEIGRSLSPPVGKTRVSDLVDELIELGVIGRPPGSRRGIQIRDLVRCRGMIDEALGVTGWSHAKPLGRLEPPCTFEHLPFLPLIELPPDAD